MKLTGEEKVAINDLKEMLKKINRNIQDNNTLSGMNLIDEFECFTGVKEELNVLTNKINEMMIKLNIKEKERGLTELLEKEIMKKLEHKKNKNRRVSAKTTRGK